MPPTRDGCDGCGGFFNMEMLAIEDVVPSKKGYICRVGKSISENPSHPSPLQDALGSVSVVTGKGRG